DGVPCRFQTRNSDVITCETPPGAAGFVDVRAENDDGGFAELPEAFEYIAPPLVDDVSPDRGTDLGGTTIEVVGENFDEGAVVVVGDTPCSVTEWIDEGHLLCTVPPGDPGIVDVTV